MSTGYADFDPWRCGLDEAGRGPLAGPVCAAAVVLGPNFDPAGLGDSKALSERARLDQAARISRTAASWGVGWAWPHEIDRLNILRASLLAMERAFWDLRARFGHEPAGALVDGLHCPALPCPVLARPKADATDPAVGAASILAKVARDLWMERWSWIDGRYAFERHKGYPTLEHRQALALHGPSLQHRLSFTVKPVQEELAF